MPNLNIHLRKLVVISNGVMADLNRKVLPFWPVSCFSCSFYKASSDSIITLFVWIQYLFPAQRIFLSMYFFFHTILKYFTPTNLNNWVVFNTSHQFFVINYFFPTYSIIFYLKHNSLQKKN